MQALTTSDTPLLEIKDRVATITLRRPELGNRLEAVDLETLLVQIAQVNESEALVLRLQANGKYFCTGFNINSIGASKPVGFEDVAAAIENSRAITVGVLQGSVYGGACDLVLACDFRLGANTIDMNIPATKLGLHFYRGGLERFVARLGVDAAKRIFLRASRLDAAQMLACGFLTDLFAPADLVAAATDLCTELRQMAPLPLLAMKKHLNRISAGKLDPDEFARDVSIAAGSRDIKEGALAWKERRVPRFVGE